MNEQSQYLQGELLNELDTLSEELSESLNLGNLGSVNSSVVKSKIIDATDIDAAPNIAKEELNGQKSIAVPALEEFTSTLLNDATELAELLFNADNSENINAAQHFGEQEINSACSQINIFLRSLLSKHLTATEKQP